MKKIFASIFFIFCLSFIAAEDFKQPSAITKNEYIRELINDGWNITKENETIYKATKDNVFLFQHEINQISFTFKNDKLEKLNILFIDVSYQDIIAMIGNYLYVNDGRIVNTVDTEENKTRIYVKAEDPELQICFTILDYYNYHALSVTIYY